MKKNVFVIVGLVGIAIAGFAMSQDHPEHPNKTKKKVPDVIKNATVTGENFCLGCSLKKEFKAGSQCKVYGHRHALRVTAAKAGGKDVKQLKGWVLHYLDTDKGQPFIKENHDKTVTLTGNIYTDERVLEVDEQVISTGEEDSEDDDDEHPDHPDHPH